MTFRTEATYKDPYRGSRDTFQTSNINSLRVVPKPVPKVDSFYHHSSPLMTFDEGNSLEHILNIYSVSINVIKNGGHAYLHDESLTPQFEQCLECCQRQKPRQEMAEQAVSRRL